MMWRRLLQFVLSVELRRGLAILVVVVWGGLSWKLIGMEVRMLGQVFNARGLSYEEKKDSIDGPLYPLMKQVKKQTPSHSSVSFIGPGPGNVLLNYGFKTKYYLYPRRVNLVKYRSVDLDSIRRSDYVVWIVLKRDREPLIDFLNKIGRLATLFRWDAQWGNRHWAMGLEALAKDPAP